MCSCDLVTNTERLERIQTVAIKLMSILPILTQLSYEEMLDKLKVLKVPILKERRERGIYIMFTVLKGTGKC